MEYLSFLLGMAAMLALALVAGAILDFREKRPSKQVQS
jgi:hypothetical protein